MSFKIILQARANSTRLPGKMLKPFYAEHTIPEIIIDNLLHYFSQDDIVLATSTHINDEPLDQIAINKGINVFRGNEQDVLQRFIDAADYFGADVIVRICADNPLLQVEYVKDLIDLYNPNENDYLSYQMKNGTPIIKSHLGLFAEITNLRTLKEVAVKSKDCFYHEHVTNYIYGHPYEFKVKLLSLPDFIGSRNDIRLTIDSQEDFELVQEIYSEIQPKCNIENILNAIDLKPSRLKRMNDQILKNSK